jgi:hypothetical protein
MKVEFHDVFVDIKELKLGIVLFLVNTFDKMDKSLWIPCHLKGFARNGAGELILAVSTSIEEEIVKVHPINVAFYYEIE